MWNDLHFMKELPVLSNSWGSSWSIIQFTSAFWELSSLPTSWNSRCVDLASVEVCSAMLYAWPSPFLWLLALSPKKRGALIWLVIMLVTFWSAFTLSPLQSVDCSVRTCQSQAGSCPTASAIMELCWNPGVFHSPIWSWTYSTEMCGCWLGCLDPVLDAVIADRCWQPGWDWISSSHCIEELSAPSTWGHERRYWSESAGASHSMSAEPPRALVFYGTPFCSSPAPWWSYCECSSKLLQTLVLVMPAMQGLIATIQTGFQTQRGLLCSHVSSFFCSSGRNCAFIDRVCIGDTVLWSSWCILLAGGHRRAGQSNCKPCALTCSFQFLHGLNLILDCRPQLGKSDGRFQFLKLPMW